MLSNLSLYFYFNIHTRWKVKTHQHINRFGIWIQNIDKAIVGTNLKVLV